MPQYRLERATERIEDRETASMRHWEGHCYDLGTKKPSNPNLAEKIARKNGYGPFLDAVRKLTSKKKD